MEGEKIYHNCAIGSCSSGAPIINLQKFKAIGIHQSRDKLVPLNIGRLLKDCIKDFTKIDFKKEKDISSFNDEKFEGDIEQDKSGKKGIIEYNYVPISSYLRIKQEFKELERNPIVECGITVGVPDEKNIYEWSSTLLGAKYSYYAGGLFNLKYYSQMNIQ